MKTAIIAIGFLCLGAAVGVVSARLEFAGDVLPISGSSAAKQPAAAPALPAVAGGSPKAVVVGGAHHDFGEMDRAAKGRHTFVVRNTGDGPLTLTKGTTTCKCTGFHFEGDKLSPGQEAKITLEWEAKTSDQEFSQSAELLTNDPQQPVVRLQIHGHVIDAVRPERPSLTLGSISANEPTVARIKVFAYKRDGLIIAKHELADGPNAALIEVKSRPLTAEELSAERGAKSGVEVEVAIAAGMPLGPIGQQMKLFTNFEELASIDIPIDGRVVGDITALGAGVNSEKQSLDLGVIRRGQAVRRTVQLLIKGPHRDITELKLQSVDPAGSLQAELGTRLGDQKVVRYPLTVVVPADAALVSRLGTAGAGSGEIVISANHPNLKQYKLFVRFAVRE